MMTISEIIGPTIDRATFLGAAERSFSNTCSAAHHWTIIDSTTKRTYSWFK